MAEAERDTVLRRKAAAGRSALGARVVTPPRALSQGFVRAADSALDLVLKAEGCTARIGSLGEMLETVPEDGLLAVLEGPGESQGLLALDAHFLASVIEKQTTGALGSAAPQPRRPTRTDAALSADFIDAVLRAFEAPLLGREDARWAAGYGYATYLDDPRPLGLLLEDVDYRLFSVTVDLENGMREGRALLALPADGKGPVGSAAPGAAGPADTPPPPPEEEFASALRAQVMGGEVRLEAVLHRMTIPLGALGRLKVGDEVPLPVSAIDRTMLVGVDGTVVGRGRLGQSGGCRALRLARPAGGAPDAAGGMAPAHAALAPPEPGQGQGPGGLPAPATARTATSPPRSIPEEPSPGPSGADLPDPADFPDLPDLPDLDLPPIE
jgi:flagellar motor switch protein FliM